MEIELRHLRYFLAVAEEGSFVAASRRLRMTQPALSRAVHALEAHVGTPLLTRHPRGVGLTAAGTVLEREARAVDEHARAAVERVTRTARGDRAVRITARGCDVGALDLLVRHARSVLPGDIRVEASVVDRRIQLEALRRGDVDLALVRTPFDAEGLDHKHVGTERRVVLLADTHRLAGRPVVDRAELAGETLPVWSDSTPSGLRWWTGTDLADHAWRPGPVVVDAAQYVATVRLGQTVAFLPESMVGEVSTAGIWVAAVTDLSGSDLHLVWPESTTARDVALVVQSAPTTLLTPSTPGLPAPPDGAEPAQGATAQEPDHAIPEHAIQRPTVSSIGYAANP